MEPKSAVVRTVRVRFVLFVSLQGVYTTVNRPGEAEPPAFPPPQAVPSQTVQQPAAPQSTAPQPAPQSTAPQKPQPAMPLAQIVHDGRRVRDANFAALQVGVRPGMRLREAAYHAPEAVQHRFDAARYRAAEEAVWQRAAAFSPRVEPIDGQNIFLDLTGAPDPEAEAQALLAALVPKHAAAARAGLASSRFVARLAAESVDWGDVVAAGQLPVRLQVVKPGDEAAFLAPLPPTALWLLPAKLHDRLARLGLTSLGQIVQAGEGPLCARLGPRDGQRVYRLASGDDPEPVAALYPPRELAARRSLPEPSGDFAALQPLLAEAAGAVTAALAREAGAAGYAEVTVEFAAGEPVARRRWFRRPQAEGGVLARALRGLLAEVDRELPRHEGGLLAGADVRAVTARLGHIREVQAAQLSLLEGTGAPTAAAVEAESRLRDVLEAVRRRFPRQLLHRGRDLKPDRREAMLRFFDPLRGGLRGPHC